MKKMKQIESRGFSCATLAASAIALVFGLIGSIAIAEQGSGASSGIEEVIVTAQRTSESIQDVPIAVTALTGDMLEDRQIIRTSDLQLNTPNVSFSSSNFGGSNLSIRGIGRLVIAASGEDGVSTHVDDIPILSNLNAIEYFDVTRVEILRGPQGTLYGRNATGGSVNVITNKPNFDAVDGFVDIEVGDYAHERYKGMFNLPLSDTFGIRIAGIKQTRDGYTENLAYGQVGKDGSTLAGIDDDIDGRDHYAIRATARWEFAEGGDLWVQYSLFSENSDRARITNQICQQNPLPTSGCLPNGFGFDNPHLGATTGGLFGAAFGALPYGATGSRTDPTVNYDFPRPTNIGFRSMHTDYEPIFESEEETWTGGLTYDFQSFTVGVLGAYYKRENFSRMDYFMDVGPTLQTALTAPPGPTGPAVVTQLGLMSYPTSEPAGHAGGDWTSPNCNYNAGTSGILGGCVLDVDTSRFFAYDQESNMQEDWTVEVKLDTAFDGPLNFVLGASAYDRGRSSDYYVIGNTLDLIGTIAGSYPTMFNSTNAPDYKGIQGEGYAFFGQAYYDVTDTLKLTVGLRFNNDEKFAADSNPFLDASFACPLAAQFTPGACPLDNPREYSRDAAFAQGDDAAYNGMTDEAGLARARAAYYDATAVFEAAVGTAPYSAERLAAVRAIPLVPQPGEIRALTNSPDEFSWEETTMRVGLDWQVSNDSLLYAFVTTGYKPGGFNPPVNPAFQGNIPFSFESEQVTSFELGSKNLFMDGSLKLNGNVFYYDYEGLQITRIAFNSSINDNVDAEIWGVELESEWLPEALPGLALNAAYSFLSAEVADGMSVDPTNRTASNPEWITLNEWLAGGTAGVNYVANLSQLAPIASRLPATIVQPPGAPSPVPVALPIPGTFYDNGIPAYVSRRAAATACAMNQELCFDTSDGLSQDISGNTLPNSPEHTINIGAAYTWDVPALRGRVIARVDYYWQGEMYAREFNTAGDEIEAWDQWNASLIYEDNEGHWSARAWVRNIEDEDNITGHYLTSDTSGFYRNYFLTEPRIFGVSLRYSVGGA